MAMTRSEVLCHIHDVLNDWRASPDGRAAATVYQGDTAYATAPILSALLIETLNDVSPAQRQGAVDIVVRSILGGTGVCLVRADA